MENVFDQCVRSPAALSFVQGVGMHQTKCIGFSMGRLLIIEKVSCSTWLRMSSQKFGWFEKSGAFMLEHGF